ncbi:isocitrate lyase/PEP mutase family protein [Amycolatopsis taiwanensis]|uniref:isocitrate lyase/PEP mutase family protein n=1 Tax=Amycolatopsis taiwanensis TaxID=342230 RepID=UPI000487A4CF|nr:isocitrate lyase/phosphoenolpyruvate mutase family protein [Amycolatopsis taiwanensis]
MDFHALHRTERPLLLPNAWDHASGAALAARGFPAVGTTSLGVAAAAGLRDGAGVTRAETVALAGKLCRLPCLVTVDIEGGFSEEPAQVAALARELAGLGVVGVNIEDGRGDRLAETRHQQELVSAIKNAVPGMFVNARTDTHWLGIAGDDEALSRARAYVRAGADGIFVPGMTGAESISALVSEVDKPVNILFSPSGPSLSRLAELGVRRVSCGSLLFRAALDAALRTVDAIADDEPVATGIIGYGDVQSLA